MANVGLGHVLYTLSVSHPTAQTWVLGFRPVAADALYSGSPAVLPLLLEGTTPPDVAGPIGGSTSPGQVTLVIDNKLGTMPGKGPRRRFTDLFSSDQRGAEGYDLESAVLRCSFAFEGMTVDDVKAQGVYGIDPTSREIADEALRLRFIQGVRLRRSLPRRRVNSRDSSGAPPTSLGRPIPLAFGERLVVPGIPVDRNGTYVFAESPTATPISQIRRVGVVFNDPATSARTAVELMPVGGAKFSSTISDASGGSTETVTEQANWFMAMATTPGLTSAWVLLARVTILLSGNGTATGELILRLERDANGVPSGDLIHPAATVTIPASTVTIAELSVNFDFETPPLIPTGVPIWWTLRRSGTGGTAVTIPRDTTPATLASKPTAGRSATKSGSDWTPSTRLFTVVPEAGLTGDGMVLRRMTGGLVQPGGVLDSYFRSMTHYIAVGGAIERRSGQSSIIGVRGFIRFPITALAGSATEAILVLRKKETLGSPGAVVLEDITDPGALADADFDAAVRATIATGTPAAGDQLYLVDVTTRFNQAKTDGLSHFALRLRLENERVLLPSYFAPGSAPIEEAVYLFVSRENPNDGPSLVVRYGTGQYYGYEVSPVGYTTSVAQDYGGQPVAAALFSRNLGNLEVAAELDGMTDPSGLYTANPGALIDNGADVLHFLMRAPIALGLDAATQIDTVGLADARAINVSWPKMRGLVFEGADSHLWLARVARCCRMIVYETEAGALSGAVVWPKGAHSLEPPIAGFIPPWRHGPLRQLSVPSASGVPLPWSRVDVFYGRDFLGFENPVEFLSGINGARGLTPLSQEPEWNGYAVISADLTSPITGSQEAVYFGQAATLEARYGQRGNAGSFEGDDLRSLIHPPGSLLTEDSAFHFIGGDHLVTQDAVVVRNYLWAMGTQRPDPFDLIEVALERLALAWNVNDEIELESWQFPSAHERFKRGEVTFPGWTHADASTFYQARRGRFMVRRVVGTLAHGADWPALVTLQLIRWVTS